MARAERHRADHVEAGDELPRRNQADPVAETGAHERIVHEEPRLPRGSPSEFENWGRRARPTLAAVDGDEIGREPGDNHRLHDGEEPRAATHAELESDRLPAGELPQAGNEAKQPGRVVEGRSAWGGERTV